jgi:hypothetical protein
MEHIEKLPFMKFIFLFFLCMFSLVTLVISGPTFLYETNSANVGAPCLATEIGAPFKHFISKRNLILWWFYAAR